MQWKWSIFSLCLWAVTTLCLADSIPDRYQRRVIRAQERWMQVIPNISSIQYAGDIGVVALGIGWDYGKNERWETHFQVGFLPKEHNEHSAATFTLRENFIPWYIGLGKTAWAEEYSADKPQTWNRRARISFQPAVFSLFLNSIFDDEFWLHEPEKYNHGNYYRFSTKMRFHIGLGGRFTINLPEDKRRRFARISYYYELSTYDLAIISAIPNRDITFGDILCLGIGVQYKMF